MQSPVSCIHCHDKVQIPIQQSDRHHNTKIHGVLGTTNWQSRAQAYIWQRPHAVCRSAWQKITLSGRLDSKSKPRNLTFSVSQAASTLHEPAGSFMRISYKGSSSVVADTSPASSSLTKALTTTWMGDTLHANRFSQALIQPSIADGQLQTLQNTIQQMHTSECLTGCSETWTETHSRIAKDSSCASVWSLLPFMCSQCSCSSQAGLPPLQRVQYHLNDLHSVCAGSATASRLRTLPNTPHTLQQLPPAFMRMPADEHMSPLHCNSLSLQYTAAGRHAGVYMHCADTRAFTCTVQLPCSFKRQQTGALTELLPRRPGHTLVSCRKQLAGRLADVLCSHPLPESLLSRRLRDVMARTQVPQVGAHIMLPDPISAGRDMMSGLAHQTNWLVICGHIFSSSSHLP